MSVVRVPTLASSVCCAVLLYVWNDPIFAFSVGIVVVTTTPKLASMLVMLFVAVPKLASVTLDNSPITGLLLTNSVSPSTARGMLPR